jgi:hypothetical protein
MIGIRGIEENMTSLIQGKITVICSRHIWIGHFLIYHTSKKGTLYVQICDKLYYMKHWLHIMLVCNNMNKVEISMHMTVFPIHMCLEQITVILPCINDVIVTRKQTWQIWKHPSEMKNVNTKHKTENDINIFNDWDSRNRDMW